jgi:hypothetical protein
MMDAGLRSVLVRLVSGDVSAVTTLLDVPHQRVAADADGVGLTVRRESVARVLRNLAQHEITGAQAQQWASFVRRGYVPAPGPNEPIKPVPIGYEAGYEDAIAEVISRLDDIGDLIDGEVPDAAEIHALLALLELPGLS